MFRMLAASTVFLVSVTALTSLLMAAAGGEARQTSAAPLVAESSQANALVKEYCVTCHSNAQASRGRTPVALEGLDASSPASHAAIWEKVLLRLRTGTMPPPKARRPDAGATAALIAALEDGLDKAAAASPDPGARTLHRLNRTEYRNAIRDLLSLDIDIASLLPPDDSSYGFDNIGDVLRVSPSLMERYLASARKISALAVGDPKVGQSSVMYTVSPDLTQDYHLDGLPFGTRGGTKIRHTFPVDGEYQIKVRLGRTTWGTVRGMENVHRIDVRVDGSLIQRFEVGGIGPYGGQDATGHDRDLHLNVTLPLSAGPHDVVVTFPRESFAQPERGNGQYAPGGLTIRKPFVKSYVDYGDVTGLPLVHRVFVEGPLTVVGSGDSPSRRRIFKCRPVAPAEEERCARSIISELSRRAYRRTATAGEVDELMGFYQSKRREGTFEDGIQMALRSMLVQPEFLFRIESDPKPGTTAGQPYAISDVELASRLSFFLWSSIPDDELLLVAEAGRLRQAGELQRQVLRMLADDRALPLTTNFAAQWLYTRNMEAAFPNNMLFPEFDDNLRQAMRKETELLFESIVREDRSVMTLLKADYTFLNERLARHYGISGVYGDHFRRVSTEGMDRGGVLGQGSILTVTSYATRTSPVQRGKWILENLFGAPPPDPPADVPPLPEPGQDLAQLNMRELMAAHRANPACASCHQQMDPMGLSLEHFDAVGRPRRQRDGSAPLDVSAEMPDGTKFNGPSGLNDVLMQHADLFLTTFTEKLMTYGLGRGLEFSDRPAVRGILQRARKEDFRFSSIVMGIVTSTAFQMRRSPEIQVPAAAAAR